MESLAATPSFSSTLAKALLATENENKPAQPAEDMMTVVAAETLALRRKLKETKQGFISPQEQIVFNNRQKALDWLLGLSHEYDVCCNQVSVRGTSTVLDAMKKSVRYSLCEVAGFENMQYLAHIFVEELFQVRSARWPHAQFTLSNDASIHQLSAEANLQSLFFRMNQEIPAATREVSDVRTWRRHDAEIEEMIDCVFPGKQGFFAYFLYYCDCAGFTQFVSNGESAQSA